MTMCCCILFHNQLCIGISLEGSFGFQLWPLLALGFQCRWMQWSRAKIFQQNGLRHCSGAALAVGKGMLCLEFDS